MASPSSCPAPDDLQRFALGEISDAEAERVQRHLTGCRRCLETLEASPTDDLLWKAVRAQASATPLPYQDAADGLIDHLCRVPPSSVGPESADTASAGQQTGPQETAPEHYDFLAPPQAPDELGRLASYRVLKVLGSGGMGVVFLAEDPVLHRLVALKTLKSTLAANDTNRRRFLREARATAAIEHDHIVPIYQVAEERGAPFLAMQLLKGQTLEQRLRAEKHLPLAEVLRIGREIASGLAAAHERGLIHRDIKPANIWLEEGSGRVKLVDFGLARGTGADAKLTDSGFVVGTPSYMAPEQARGEAVDPRGDLFSLGCVLYRLCTGQVPFDRHEPLATLLAVTTDRPPSPAQVNPQIPRGLSDLVMRLLAKNRADRPADAGAVIAALWEFERGGVPGTLSTPGRWRGQRLLTVSVATLLLGAIGSGIWLSIFGQAGPDSAAPHAGTETVAAKTEAKTLRADPWPGPDRGPDVPHSGRKEPSKSESKPLSSTLALVSAPAEIVGVQGWTIETRGHRGPVRAAAYSPDGGWLATAGLDGTVRLWQPGTGKLSRILVGGNFSVDSLSWQADGKVLAARSNDGTVRLWEADSGRQRKVLATGSGGSFALAPDGQTLATSSGRELRLWNTADGKLLETLPGNHALGGFPVTWSPDSRFLAVGAADLKSICLWERGTKEPRLLQGHKDVIIGLAWSPEGKQLVSAGRDQTLCLWDVAARAVVRVYPWQARNKPAGLPTDRVVAWPADGKRFASINSDGVQFWDPKADQPIPVGSIPLSGWLLSVSADGKAVATVGADDVVQVRHADSGKLSFTLPGYKHERVGAVSWSRDGKRLALRGNRAVRVWDAASGRLERTLEGHAHDIIGLAWSADGAKLATTAGTDRKILIQDVATGNVLHTLETKAGFLGPVAWSPDGGFLAVASDQPKDVWLWEGNLGKAPRSLGGYSASVTGLAWQPEGKVLAISSADGMLGIRFWDAAAGKDRRIIHGKNGGYNGVTAAIAWSADGQLLAAAGADNQPLKIFDGASGRLVDELQGQEGRVLGLTWLDDGRALLSRADDEALWFWDTGSGQLGRTIGGRSGMWNYLPERGLLHTGCFSYTMRLRDVATNSPQATLLLVRQGQLDAGLAVTPQGHYRASGRLEAEIVFVVQTENGQQLLSPEDFTAKHGWKNDPKMVQLVQQK